jgi:hypothetical protein
MRNILFAAAFALAGCTATPTIAPEPLAEIPEAVPESPGQLVPIGWCTEYTSFLCTPDSATAGALCSRQYGETFGTPMECWESNDAVNWGCVPLCGQEIVCPGAEASTSALWCCPW